MTNNRQTQNGAFEWHKDSQTDPEHTQSASTQLDPEHLLNCLVIAAALFRIYPNCARETLYSEKAEDVARAVLRTFGPI